MMGKYIAILRIWLFRCLVAIAAYLMVLSFMRVWWTAIIGEQNLVQTADIYAWGIRKSEDVLGIYEYFTDTTPYWQTVLAWIFLGVSVGLILYSTWLKGRKGQLLLGGVGLIYAAYALIAIFVVVKNRTAELAVPLQGWMDIGAPGAQDPALWEIPLTTSIEFWWYMTFAAAGACILLALLRNIIVGKPKSITRNTTAAGSIQSKNNVEDEDKPTGEYEQVS